MLAVSALVGAPLAAMPSDNDQLENQRIKDKIRVTYANAQNIIIDGNGGDWAEIPVIRSPGGDIADSGRDITGLRIAPLADRLLVLIETKGAPVNEPWSYYLEVNLTGQNNYDFQLGLRCNGPVARLFSHKGKFRGEVPGLKCVTGAAVEIEIPYGGLSKVLPGLAADLARKARGFAVVMPFTFDNAANAAVDRGFANACYVLSDKPGEIGGKIPKPVTDAFAIQSPFRGQWFVTRGAWVGDHAWAYDISIRDARYRRKVDDSERSEAYLAWGQPVYSPVNGVVQRIQNDTPDNPEAGKYPANFALNNGTWIKADDALVILVHMMQNSVVVSPNQAVQRGDVLGKTGSSGRSLAPHIHLQTNWVNKKESRPTAIRNVTVGINAGNDDPWARNLDVWDITEGFFFQSRAP